MDNAPAAEPLQMKRVAPAHYWPTIARFFKRGFDSYRIAFFLGITESEVHNALAKMREEKRT